MQVIPLKLDDAIVKEKGQGDIDVSAIDLHVLECYRRSGFNCEYVIIANCEFISSSQKLERNKRCTQSIVRYEANQQATNAERSRAAWQRPTRGQPGGG